MKRMKTKPTFKAGIQFQTRLLTQAIAVLFFVLCGFTAFSQDTLRGNLFSMESRPYPGWHPENGYVGSLTSDTVYYEEFLSQDLMLRYTYSKLSKNNWALFNADGTIRESGRFRAYRMNMFDRSKKNISRVKAGTWLYFKEGRFLETKEHKGDLPCCDLPCCP